MLSHAPLCGINRPHVRHWSRTNRIDPILELLPVTSDTAAVPPPTRSPEPKVTRYIVIRNDQHGGSPHHGKIFIVAGDRLATAHLPGKATITFRNHLAHPGPTARPRGPASRSARADFRARRAERSARPGAGVRNALRVSAAAPRRYVAGLAARTRDPDSRTRFAGNDREDYFPDVRKTV
jgi:hypothetical protein